MNTTQTLTVTQMKALEQLVSGSKECNRLTQGTFKALERRGLVVYEQIEGSPQGFVRCVATDAGRAFIAIAAD